MYSTFPDNGDVDFIRAIRAYKEVGYDGMLMPDHVPKTEGDTDGRRLLPIASNISKLWSKWETKRYNKC